MHEHQMDFKTFVMSVIYVDEIRMLVKNYHYVGEHES